jgi:hypothetical protein
MLTHCHELQRAGRSCIFAFPSTSTSPTDRCLAAAFLKLGSAADAVLSPLKVVGQGSPSIKFSGFPDDVNRALEAISYKTLPYYNQLYRPPLYSRSALFDATIDSFDTLVVVADDLGNSGGLKTCSETPFFQSNENFTAYRGGNP